jgi:hypothetical protein
VVNGRRIRVTGGGAEDFLRSCTCIAQLRDSTGYYMLRHQVPSATSSLPAAPGTIGVCASRVNEVGTHAHLYTHEAHIHANMHTHIHAYIGKREARERQGTLTHPS